MTSLDALRETYQRVTNALQTNMAASGELTAGQISEFWRNVFAERKNFPELNDLMVFRREGYAYGIGDDRQGSLEREREYSERMYLIFGGMVGKEFIARLDESTFGAPLVFQHDGIERSASFWINTATTRRVHDFVSRFGKSGPLRVLEIGAGWGACAHQLHSVLDIDSYTIVDLPHNLHISSVYLATVLPQRPLAIFDVNGQPVDCIPSRTIVGCLPATIARLKAKYDLIINSFSLQEMPLDTVAAYIDWIAGALADDGLFISLNSHGKAGVRKPSDYRYDRFHIHHWGVFRQRPPGFLNTIPYEVVAGRRKSETPVYESEVQDGLGWLMQLGLDRDLDLLCEGMVKGRLDARQNQLVAGFARFFAAETDTKRAAILESLRSLDGSPVWPFVRAHLALVQDEDSLCAGLLEEACRRGLSGFAFARAKILLAGLARKRGGSVVSVVMDGFDPTLAYPEAAAIVQGGDVEPMKNQADRVLRRR